MILRGFALRIEDSGEDDLNLIFFSSEQGKIRILVKGARKPLSKLRGLAQFFVLSKLAVIKGKRNNHLIGGEEIKSFRNIFKSYKKIKESSFLLSVLDNFFPFLKKDHKIFILTFKALEKINSLKEEKSEIIASAFLIKFLAFFGFKPELKRCLVCHKTLKDNFLFFDFKEGGTICLACRRKNVHRQEISKEILDILQKLLYNDFNSLAMYHFKEENLKIAREIIEKFLIWRK